MIGFARRAAASVVDETALVLQQRRRRRADALMMFEGEGRYRLYERKRGAARLLAEGSVTDIAAKCGEPLRRRSVELRLDPARVIDKVIRIPAGSRLYADAVVRHQLDRMTPWAPNKVVFDFEELGVRGQGAAAEIELRVVVIARTALKSVQDACAQAGIRLDRIGVASGDVEAPSGINLASDSKISDIAKLRGTVRTALSGLLLLGGVATAGSFLFVDFTAREGEALAQGIGSARTAAADLRRGAEVPANPVLAMKLKPESVPTAVLINEVSRVLPEGTYLTALVIEDQKLRLTGLSDKASALIGLIEDSSVFDGVAFAAPVLRGQTGGLERFEILASFGGPIS